MSQDNFKKHMLSSEHEQDDFFLPSDSVWSGIEEELDGHPKRRKPFIYFFSTLIVVGVLFASVYPKPIDSSSYGQSVVNIQQTDNFVASELKIKEKSIEQISDHNSTGNSIENYNSHAIQKSQASSSSSSLLRKSSSFDFQRQELSRLKYRQEIKHSNYVHNSYSKISQTLAQTSFNKTVINENLSANTVPQIPVDQMRRTEIDDKMSNLINRDLIAVTMLSSKISYLNITLISPTISPPIVHIQEESVDKDWSIRAHIYSSISNYSISNFTGFGELEFDLKGKTSYGYQMTVEKEITSSISLYAGIGIDHAYFDANYLLTVDASQLDFMSLDQPDNTARFSKTIPSLAGGLESTFVLNNVNSDLRQAEVNLSLAHDFKTVTVPIGARFSLVKSKDLRASFAVGVEYSKRLLSIDTGVNSLSSNKGEIELTSASVVAENSQAFTIHNINATAAMSLDYQMTKRMSIGVQTGIIRPLSSVYQDANFSVDTYQIRGGINIRYALLNK